MVSTHRHASLATWLGLRLLRQPILHLARFAAGKEETPPMLPGELRHLAEMIAKIRHQPQEGSREHSWEHSQEVEHALAALFHRLRTPLTRLRLRVERVGDEALKDALRQDLRHIGELLDSTQDALHDGCVMRDTKRTNPLHTAKPG